MYTRMFKSTDASWVEVKVLTEIIFLTPPPKFFMFAKIQATYRPVHF
jgi:hypothetical protein